MTITYDQAGVTYDGAYSYDGVSTGLANIAPTHVVEIGFDARPTDAIASIIWTDATVWTRNMAMRRGRQHYLDRNETGVASVVLDNDDRRFDPTNTSGPYVSGGVSKVLPYKRIRVTALWNSTAYPIFHGYVTGWPQSFDTNTWLQYAQIEAADAFTLFNLWSITPYSTYVTNDAPVSWWKLDETSGTAAADSSDTNPGTYAGGYTLNQGGPFTSLGKGAVSLNGTTGQITVGTPANLKLTGALTLEAWVYFNSTASFQPIISALDPYILEWDGTTNTLQLQLNYISGPTQIIKSSTWTPATNTWYHVAVTRDPSTSNVTFYINGVQFGTASYGKVVNTSYTVTLGSRGGDWFNGRIAHAAIYNKVLTASTIAAHYDGKTDTFTGGLSSACVNAILDAVNWPAADRAIDTGDSTLQGFTPSGTVLSILDDIRKSENGLLFMGRDGKVYFKKRSSQYNQVTVGIIGDANAENNYLNVTHAYDDSEIWNDVRTTRTGGTEQRANDLTSINAYGTRTLSVSMPYVASDAELQDAANYLLSKYRNPKLWIRGVQFDGRAGLKSGETPEWPMLLGRELGDTVTVNRRPQPFGSTPTISQLSFLSALDLSMDTDGPIWNVNWQLIPADQAAFWILGDSVNSLLGQTTTLGY